MAAQQNYPRTVPQKSKRTTSPTFVRSLLGEFAGTAVGVFLVLLGITVITQLTRLLDQAASGALPPEGVAAFLGFRTLGLLPVLLSLTLFASVLLTLTRSYRDSEMVVWFCSGLSLTAWVRPVVAFALPLVATVALLSLILTPWAVSKSDEFMQFLNTRDELSGISPGVFQESKHADRVYFVESQGRDPKRVSNIFVQSVQNQKLGVMLAKGGFQETAANGDRFLVLVNGSRYEGVPGSPDYSVMSFERYAVRVEPYEAKPEAPSAKALSTLALLREPTLANLAELGWRIGLPVSALILALLAIPLSFVNPRAGRSANLALAILVYMIYSNLMSVAQVWVSEGRISPLAGIWGVHAAMGVVLLFLFYRRLSVFSLARFRR